MLHLDDGALRRLADEPLAMTDSHRRHYDACRRCQERYDHIAGDARLVAGLLAAPAPSGYSRIDVAAALNAVHRRIAVANIAPAPRHTSLFGRRVSSGYRRQWSATRPPHFGALGRLSVMVAALVVVGAFLWTPAGSLAQSFFGLFQPTRIQAIQTTSAELASLRVLSKYGTLHVRHIPARITLTGAAAASTRSGMDVLTPRSGLSGVPAVAARYTVQPRSTASFTFSAARARAAAVRLGEKIPPMPAKIDGSTLQITIGTTVITMYPTGGGQIPQLAIGQMRAPTVSSTGVSVKTLENYVLNLPEVPSGLAQQIESITNPNSTLPIPIPIDLVSSQSVQVQGVSGIEVGDNTGVGSGVIWEKNGIIYAVAGTLTDSQALAIADSLH